MSNTNTVAVVRASLSGRARNDNNGISIFGSAIGAFQADNSIASSPSGACVCGGALVYRPGASSVSSARMCRRLKQYRGVLDRLNFGLAILSECLSVCGSLSLDPTEEC